MMWSTLFVVIGVNWAVGDIRNGFDAGWGDTLFGYVGTPLAAGLAAVLATHELHLRSGGHRPSALGS